MDEDDNAWVFDSLVCFLNGPVWNAPLQSFIEEKSLIFEPNNEDNEEYLKIFDEFKNLVDFMLGNFMEDIGITPQQFEEACNMGNREQIPVQFDQNLFEQIWAANDYEIFKRLMTQRNVELQLEALELIEQKYGITPQSFIPNKNKSSDESSTKSVDKTSSSETEIMNEVIKKFPEETLAKKEEVGYLLKEKQALEEKLKKAIEVKPIIQQDIQKEELKTVRTQIGDVDQRQLSKTKETEEDLNKIEVAKKQEEKTAKKEIDGEELKKRQEYLRAQRDKLVALKKEVRKKQLDTENKTAEVTRLRPKSAKAAEQVLTTGNTSIIEPQQLQIRKALAERLKSEVVSAKK